MPNVIYVFQDGRWSGDFKGMSIAKVDGKWTCLEQLVSSSVDWLKRDLGVIGEQCHDSYKKVFPHGFIIEWVDKLEEHPVLSEIFMGVE